MINNAVRHPGEGRGPGLEPDFESWLKAWIPAFAGKTVCKTAEKHRGNRPSPNLYFQLGLGAFSMKTLRQSALFALSLIALGASFPIHAEDVPDPMVLEQERKLKSDSEAKAQQICDSILGKEMANVLVNVELGLETTHKGGSNLNRKLDNKAGNGLGSESFILPWVPAPKSVTKEEVPKDASVATQAAQQDSVDIRTVVKRFDITVVHDKSIPQAQVDDAKAALESSFDRFKNVLKIFFRPSSFLHREYDPKATVTKNLWDSLNLRNLLFLLLLLCAFPLLKFLKSVADFLQGYLEGMKELSKSRVEMENKSQSENETDQDQEGEQQPGEGELTPEEMAALEAEEEAMKKLTPFTYITDENLKQLAYLLHHEEPWVVALVISYLSPEHGFKVMEALPADMQAKVALETAMYRQTSEDQVRTINEDIKQKIDFVVGGMDKLVGILENSDRMAQDNILEYLKNEKPALYERVREQILLFEDIVNFPKLAMQVVVRELKTDELARALRGASPDLQQKFFENMSQGAVTLLKEEMEYGRPVTEEQIADERKKIVDFMKSLEKDGKISFRQRGKAGALSSEEVGEGMMSVRSRLSEDEALSQLEAAAQADPSSVEAVQNLANAYYTAGRYTEAISTYDQLLALQPNAELETWVNELRASIQASAA
jgi:flagellar motor switch protein FliG